MIQKTALFAVFLVLSLSGRGESLDGLRIAYEASLAATRSEASGFDARWQAARAARLYGAAIVSSRGPGWKDLARTVSKEGMRQADLAASLRPGRVEGWYWYCRCVQTYTECVSILTAFFEGLQGKSQTALENAYRIDKSYDDGLPILSLGRYWQVLPAIAGRDLGKAEALLDEYIAALSPAGKVAAEGWLFRGELNRELKRLDAARADFSKAAAMGDAEAARQLEALR